MARGKKHRVGKKHHKKGGRKHKGLKVVPSHLMGKAMHKKTRRKRG